MSSRSCCPCCTRFQLARSRLCVRRSRRVARSRLVRSLASCRPVGAESAGERRPSSLLGLLRCLWLLDPRCRWLSVRGRLRRCSCPSIPPSTAPGSAHGCPRASPRAWSCSLSWCSGRKQRSITWTHGTHPYRARMADTCTVVCVLGTLTIGIRPGLGYVVVGFAQGAAGAT